MNIYTLLYIEKQEKQVFHRKLYSENDRVAVFVKCSILLAKTLNMYNHKLIILTNDVDCLTSMLAQFNYKIEVRKILFELDVPKGIRFYSAHFKIDAFRYLSTLSDEYIFFIDCDIVLLNDFSKSVQNIINERLPMRYVLPRYHLETSLTDMQKIDRNIMCNNWSGGEFIGGTPVFYSTLYNQILNIKDVYFQVYPDVFHQGDEMLTSVAIEALIRDRNLKILDAGVLGVVYRYWSIFESKDLSEYNICLAHLPYDKVFLSSISGKDILSIEDFMVDYGKYKRQVNVKRRVKNIISLLKFYFLGVNVKNEEDVR